MLAMNILVVDDSDETRERLVQGLNKYGFSKVTGTRSGEIAISMITKEPDMFNFAIIDHKLEKGKIDGIETTRRISKIASEIFPIVFTNIPSDNPDVIKKFRANAYDAGAYRYMYRGGLKEEIKNVADIVNEIEQLRQLKQRVIKFYESQEKVPSLLTHLDIMVTLIDRRYKIWYMNRAALKFYDLIDIPSNCCAEAFYGYKNEPPCKGCAVQKAILEGKKNEGIYLQPIPSQGGMLKYFYIWTEPIWGEDSVDDKINAPIAVLESAHDLTGSNRIIDMSLDERTSIIANSLYNHENGFDRIRIYKTVETTDVLKLIASAGYPEDLGGAIINISDYPAIKITIKNYGETGNGTFYYESHKDPIQRNEIMTRFAQWPLMKGNRLIGFFSVSSIENGRSCSEDKLDLLRDYANEALNAFEGYYSSTKSIEVENAVSNIENILIKHNLTPEIALEKLLNELCKMTDSDMAHIRIREGRVAKLFPISVGKYAKLTPKELPISGRMAPAVRVIMSGRSEIQGRATVDELVQSFRKTMSKEIQELLKNCDSTCCVPLIFIGQCIGSITLHKMYAINHYDEKKVAIVHRIADHVALAVHDYHIKAIQDREREEKLTLEAKKDMAIRAVHNIRNPVDAAHTFLSVLKNKYEFSEEALNIIKQTEGQIIRIEKLASDFLRYLNPIKMRIERISLNDFISSIISNNLCNFESIEIIAHLNEDIPKVDLDKEGFYWIFEEMIRNSKKNDAKEIIIRTSHSRDKIEIIFEDNGNGVNKDIEDKIFEPFHSSDSLGTGLGLTNIKMIVEEHKGEIIYDRSFSPGARFQINLPIKTDL